MDNRQFFLNDIYLIFYIKIVNGFFISNGAIYKKKKCLIPSNKKTKFIFTQDFDPKYKINKIENFKY